VVAAAVSLHWEPDYEKLSQGIYHFAQINCRDGFFLVGRETCKDFLWDQLNSKEIFFFGRQPETALKYAVNKNLEYVAKMKHDEDAENLNDASIKPEYKKKDTMEGMLRAFCKGTGDFIHLQGYWAQQLVDENPNWCIVKVGEYPVPEYSFSSLMASKKFIENKNKLIPFMKAYKKALYFAATGEPQEIADKLKCFFFPMAKETPVVLKNCIEQYQALGCWRHDGQITQMHYNNAKAMFREVEGVKDVNDAKKIHDLPYSRVVQQPWISK
jgi:hypothetical protein